MIDYEIIYCNSCNKCNNSASMWCEFCGAPLDNDEIENDKIVSTSKENYDFIIVDDNNVIKRHNFELSKKEIKAFAEKTPSDVELEKFKISGGIFGLGDHKVTGYEMNEYTEKLQGLLISLNQRDIEITSFFDTVYQALEFLDKDLIQGLIISTKLAEKAGVDAQKAQNDINETIKALADAQDDIKNTMSALEKTILKLHEFKEQINKIKHLKDIDHIWEDFRKIQKEVTNIIEEVSKAVLTSKENAKEIKTLSKFKEKLDKINHIKDIDKLWEDSQSVKKCLPIIEKQIKDIENALSDCLNNLSDLNALKTKIDNIKHIDDVDMLWDNFQKTILDITNIRDDVCNIENKIETFSLSIALLLDFKKKIDEINHIYDLDNLWDDVLKLQHDTEISKCNTEEIRNELNSHKQSIHKVSDFIEELERYEHLKDIDTMWNKCSSNESDIKNTKENVCHQQEQIGSLQLSVTELQSNIEKNNKSFSKKLTLAYVLTGTSLGIAIIEFILLILR